MKPSESAVAFTEFANSNGILLSNCTPREGIQLMFSFYELVSPQGCEGTDGDMLLFQWGIYDWDAQKHFELNITRQFIEQEFKDDNAISQLRLTFNFEPTAERGNLGNGYRWCDGLTSIEIIREFVFGCPPFLAVADTKAIAIELTHSYI